MVMRKLYYLSMFAVAAMAAFSCTKELKDNNKPEKDFEPKVISAFTDDDVKSDTKTSLSGVSVLWATTDNIKGWDGSAVHTSTATAVSEGNKKAEFTFDGVLVETDLFTLAYPAEKISNIDDDFVYATIPSTQTATANSFADKANIAIAEGLEEHPVFKNVGGLLSFTINNDNIRSVTLSANENLTGASQISLASASFAEATITSGKKFVTLEGTISNGTEYYAVVYPGTYTGLTIEVTDASGRVAKYTNSNPLTVARNGNLHVATLTISHEKWEDIEKGVEYVMTPASGVWANWATYNLNDMAWTPVLVSGKDNPAPGNYITGKGYQFGTGSKGIVNMTLTGTGYTQKSKTQSGNAKAFGITDITVSLAAKKNLVYTVTAAVGGVTVESSKNATGNGDTPVEVSFHSDTKLAGDIVITYAFSGAAENAGYLCINTVTINPDNRTPQTLSFPNDSYFVELSEGTFASPTLSGAQTTVTYSSDDEDVATVNASTGVVTLKTEGTVNITATAVANATYKEGSASYELTINPGPSAIADVISASSGATVYTEGVVAQVNSKGFILTDGSDNIFVYQNAAPSVVAGQAAKVRGTRDINNSVAQISSPTITAGATGQSITRTSQTVVTSANAKGYTTSTYVSLSGDLSNSGAYYNVSIAGSTVAGSLYNVTGSDSFTGGTLTELIGAPVIVTGYVVGSTNSYLTIAVVDVVINPDVAYIATTPSNGSTIEWDNDKYGNTYEETITIVQNGNATGYSVEYTGTQSDWNIDDDGAGTLTYSPKAANTSNSADKTLTVTITHNDDGEKTSVVTLVQKKVPGAATTLVNETFDSGNSNIDSKLTLTNETGSQTDFARLGKSGKSGKIACAIPAASATGKTLTVTFDANRWSATEKTLTISVTNGTASISSVDLANTMSGATSSPAWNSTCDKISFTVTPENEKVVTIEVSGNARFLLDNFKVVAQ